MYADDLALVADSASTLQSLLDIVSEYAAKWRYQLNASKSGIMVFGESPNSRALYRRCRSWSLCSSPVGEVDEYRHFGILRSISLSNRVLISDRCTSGRSAFFALNAVGSRFGRLNPTTSYKLYSALSLPILLYGSELWILSKFNILMLNRIHRKILRTIQGLPVRCPSVALTALIGSNDIQKLIQARQLSFVNSFACMAETDLPKQVLLARLNSNMNKGTIHGWERAISDLNLPDITSLTSMGGKNKPSWKRHIKKQIYISQQLNLIDLCDSYHVANISLKLGKPCRIWSSTRKCRINTPSANFRIRLITGCDGLESDASRFRYSLAATAARARSASVWTSPYTALVSKEF